MRLLALFLIAVLTCDTTAQIAAKKKTVLFCVLPDQFRVLALECLWRQTYRHVQEMISNILVSRQWGAKQLAHGLCNPYEIFKLKKFFKKKSQRKLLGHAIAQAEACIVYIVKNYINGAAAQ
uniref:Putative secreted protein n=1 Tax=Amblyomma parvum TaxID=251391 RepID=A0A023FZ75_AMBPA